MNVFEVARSNFGALIIGAVLVPVGMVSFPIMSSVGTALYDTLRPVVTDWTVFNSEIDGADVLISGTLVKKRDCLFIPPTLARDIETGRNYAVVSTSPTAGKTWASSDLPQAWGPWRVINGAGKTLMFINIYQCGNSQPVASELGLHVAESWTK